MMLGAGTALLLAASVGFSKAADGKKSVAKPALSDSTQAFLNKSCISCHNKKSASGGLNLTAMTFRPGDAANIAGWRKIYERVSQGEMPPKAAPQPTEASRRTFLAALAQTFDNAHEQREGRAVWRRMNRYEYENTLRDLLDAPWLQIKDMLPEDGLAYRFNKVGEALDVSHVQMSRYLSAAEYALQEAMPKQITRPETKTTRYYAYDQRSFAGLARFSVFNGSPERATFPIVGDHVDPAALKDNAARIVGSSDPAVREQEGMGVVASAYEPLQPKFNQFRAPVAGRYKLRLCAHSFWAGPENEKRWWRPSRSDISAGRTHEPISLYASFPPQRLRKLGSVDCGPKSTIGEMEVELLKGESIEPDAVRFFRSRPPNWHNPLAQKDGQPGVCFQWLEVTGPIYDSWPTKAQTLLFGDLPLTTPSFGKIEAVSKNPDADADRLIHAFVKQALRRPITEQDVQPFVKLSRTARDAGASFTESLLTAYEGVLCAPAFVTMEERPGPLGDHALASRLSYFLWNSEPDARLRAVADRGELHKPAVLLAQADRLLADPRSKRFVDAFLDYWLDLRKTDGTSPDEGLYPDYYLDDYLVESSVAETRAFFGELMHDDLPARNLVSSDFVMINDRLAELYGIPGVQGSAIRKVTLPKDSERGGLLTQASVLKVTANGTTTSPVLRGVWINERILGNTVPPPPPSVPAIEPDTRGATTIKEQLAKHRTQPTCKACHAKIDPAGFALESFDVFGGKRECYRAVGDGTKVAGYGKNGQAFQFHDGPKVDPSGDLPDGRHFNDVGDLKRLILQNERQVVRNLANQLIIYGTGAPVRFGDTARVEAILDRAKPSGYGVKSLIKAIVASELFRNK
jgi:hypothetical protein